MLTNNCLDLVRSYPPAHNKHGINAYQTVSLGYSAGFPKTIAHINVGHIAEIDKDKTLLTRGAVKKGRAGGGVPPWGRQ